MINLKTIKNNARNEIIIKNSKFITNLIKVNSPNDVKSILSNIKKEYPNATHYCYGYIIDNDIKASDDNEPNNTASKPIIDILTKKNLNNIICIIARYFGGIKLGVGGLLRAYSNSVSECLKKTTLCDIIDGKNMSITFVYTLEKDINYLLKEETILEKRYNDKITYNINIKNIDIINKLNKYNVIINNIKNIKIES